MRALSRGILLLFLFGITCSACQGISSPIVQTSTPLSSATPLLTATQAPVKVDIDAAVVRQTLREVGGGNFIHYFGGVENSPLDPISTLNLKTLQPAVVRTRMDLDVWQPNAPAAQANDAVNPYQDVSFVHAAFEFLQTVQSQRPDTIFIASIWEVPDWMVSNPDAENNRIIPPEQYQAAIESIGAWLLRAKEEYGVEVDYFSFNEANIGINILLTSAEQVDFIRKAGPHFAQLGLKTRFLLGDTANSASAMSYIPPIYAAEDIRPYLGPLSFHSWDSQVADQLLRDIGKFSDANNLEVWCTEGGWDPAQWHRTEEFATWKHAVKMANIYTRVLRDTRATALLYWEMMGGDYAINNGTQPFPALVYLAELQRAFPAGAQIVQTPQDEIATLTVLSLAAKQPDGGFAVELLNQVNSARTAHLTGLPNGTYSLIRLSEKEGRQELQPLVVQDNQLLLDLPGSTITFLRSQRP